MECALFFPVDRRRRPKPAPTARALVMPVVCVLLHCAPNDELGASLKSAPAACTKQQATVTIPSALQALHL
eukprot:1846103-Pleurochrysis_carterae.AAC.1